MTKAIVLLCDIFMQIVPNYGKFAIVRDSTFIWCQFVLGFILATKNHAVHFVVRILHS